MSNIVRRILLIISVIGLIATGSLWYISGQDLSGSKEKFLLKAYTTNEKDIQKMKSKAEAQGYETQLGKTKRITKQKDGYRVVFYYHDKKTLSEMMGIIKSKKMAANLNKDKEKGTYYIEAVYYENQKPKTVFYDKGKAGKVKDQLSNITYFKFSLEDNYKKVSLDTQVLTVKDIAGSEAADGLAAEFKAIPKVEVEVEPMAEDDGSTAPPVKSGKTPASGEPKGK